jgi:hypothetical protein
MWRHAIGRYRFGEAFYSQPCDQDPKGRKEERGEGSPARCFPAKTALEVDGGEVPVTNGDDGVADNVQQRTAVSET